MTVAASFLEEEDDLELEDGDDVDDLSDPCHEYEHSVLFFLILAASATMVAGYCYLLAKRSLDTPPLHICLCVYLNFSNKFFTTDVKKNI